MRDFILISFLLSWTMGAKATPPRLNFWENDKEKIAEYQERCKTIDALIVRDAYPVECYTNYNHYGPVSRVGRNQSSLRIANYNLLYPGTSQTLFKDYGILAKIINQYDIVSGLELLSTIGEDEQHNNTVLNFMAQAPELLAKLEQQKKKEKNPERVKELEDKIERLLYNEENAHRLYRGPGYLRVLVELKRLDPSWSLLLTPRGDSAQDSNVEELAGFYYRARAATPAVNPHCKDFAPKGAGTPVACFVTLTKNFMGQDFVQHFSRRPFMATFEVGASKITLVTSHVVFSYSGTEKEAREFMQKTFGVDSYKNLGEGINGVNFARYAEVKTTLDFMNRYRQTYKDPKIMLMSDMNLVSTNAFWPEVLKAFPGGELFIKEATTLSPSRYSSTGKETRGVANDYDHFILDRKAFPTCSEGEVFNYYHPPPREDYKASSIYAEIEKKYVIRQEVGGVQFAQWPKGEPSSANFTLDEEGVPDQLDYPLTAAGEEKMVSFVSGYQAYLKNIFTIKKNEVVPDDLQIDQKVDALKNRVFLRQLTNASYYRFMQELLSDHFPVAISCKF